MNFIITNLHLVSIGVALVAAALYALKGLYRSVEVEADEEIRSWAYRDGHKRRVIVAGAILVAVAASVAWVPRGYVGVTMSVAEGIVAEERPAGLNLMVPFTGYVTNVNTQIQIYRHNDPKVLQHTFDTQEIGVPIAVNFRTIGDRADYVYGELAGGPFTIIEPALLRALRTAIGSYSLEDIAPNQVKITTLIEDEIRPQLAKHGIEIVYVAIEDTIAKEGIIAAIEQERIAERNKSTAQHNRDIAFTEAEGKVFTANGDAKAIERIALAEQERLNALGMTPNEYIWYTRTNLVLPQVMTGGGEDLILPLPDLAAAETAPTTVAPVTEDE